MSRIKELQENPSQTINVAEFLTLLCPDGKSKYLELFFNLIKNEKIDLMSNGAIRASFAEKFKIPIEQLEKFDDTQLFYFGLILYGLDVKKIETFQNFCSYNERGLIHQKDVTKYKTFKEIEQSASDAEQKLFKQELKSHVKPVYEDENWLIIRPLTYEASKKYGASTKWCTASNQTQSHFITYTTNGILIYCISKKSRFKVAVHKLIGVQEGEITFWDDKDIRKDALSIGLPFDILKIIKCEIDTYPMPNVDLLPDNLRHLKQPKIDKPLNLINNENSYSGLTTNINLSGYTSSSRYIVYENDQSLYSLTDFFGQKSNNVIATGRSGFGSGGRSGTSGTSGFSGTSGSSGIPRISPENEATDALEYRVFFGIDTANTDPIDIPAIASPYGLDPPLKYKKENYHGFEEDYADAISRMINEKYEENKIKNIETKARERAHYELEHRKKSILDIISNSRKKFASNI